MKFTNKIIIFIVFIGICFPLLSSEDDGSYFKVKLEKDKVKAGEPFQYYIQLRIESKKVPNVEISEFENFKVVSKRTSKKISYQKNKLTYIFEFRYVIIALNEGSFSLPTASFNKGGEKITSPVKKVDVVGKAEGFEKDEDTDNISDGAVSI